MKRKNNIFSTIALFCAIIIMTALPLPVAEAANFSVSKTNVSIENGKSTTITINASTHTGRLDITSSNSNVATVDITNLWVENNSKTITISAKSTGSAKITIQGELFDESTNEEKMFTQTINVNVTKASSGSSSGGTTNNNQTSNPGTSNSGTSNSGNQSSGTSNSGNLNAGTSSGKPSSNTNSNTSSSSSTSNKKPSSSNIQNNNSSITSNSSESIQQAPISEEVVEPIAEQALPQEEIVQEDVIKEETNAELQESASVIIEEIDSKQEDNNSAGKIIIMGAITLVAILTIGSGIVASKKILRK